MERKQRAALREGHTGHEGDQIGGGLVLLGEAVEAVDHHLGIINGGTKIRKPIGEGLDLLKIVGHTHLSHLDIAELGREVELTIDLVVVEETVDAVPEIDGEGIVAGRHDGVEDAERDRPIEPRDDGGVEERPLRVRRIGSIEVEVIQEGVLATGGAEEGAPLTVNAGVKRELDGNVSLDGVQADGLGMQRGQGERPRARPRSIDGGRERQLGLGGLGVLALLGSGQRLVRRVGVGLRHGCGGAGAAAREEVVASTAAEGGEGRHRLGLGF